MDRDSRASHDAREETPGTPEGRSDARDRAVASMSTVDVEGDTVGPPERLSEPTGDHAVDDTQVAVPPGVTLDPAPHHGGHLAGALEPGAIINQYELIRLLGRGGMGHVFLARDTRLGRLVALKFLTEHSGARARWFISEARATAQFNHENVVVIYEVGEHGGFPFMALEYVRGQTLREWLDDQVRQAVWAERRPAAAGTASGAGIVVPPRRAVELMTPVVRALVRAHDLGIVHRDLKLANVMLAEDGTVKVLDFGVAKILGDAAAGSDGHAWPRPASPPALTEPALSQADGQIGTTLYMSPEQWGVDTVDHRTDIWAVGLMLHELVLGGHPLIAGDVMAAAVLPSVADLDTPMPSVRERCPELGKLGLLIDRCLIKRKADRIGSARALLAELEALAWPRRGARARDEDASPYPGLAAFQELDADRFFGRERVVQQVLGRLDEQPLVALVGPSGAGKSSFVRAGLIPALERSGGAWEAFVIRPGASPLAALAELIAQHDWAHARPPWRPDTGTGEPSPAAERAAIRARLAAEPGFLGVQLRARARRKLARILLFVDQLEELYTLAPAGEREAFLACLAGVADDVGSATRVVVAMRSDLLDRVAEAHATMTGLSRGLLLLTPLDRAALREVLVRPLEAVEYRFEDEALVEEMLDALAHTRGALPLLQFTAAKLWEQRDRQRRVLTAASYRALGGVAGTLASHADAVLGAMPAVERRLARAALLRLVTPERTRALSTIGELRELAGAAEDMDRVLARLIDARLLVVETGADAGDAGDESAGVVELVHESLIERWPLLAQWLRESEADAAFLARLRGAAGDWDRSGRAEDLLWRGQPAQEARRWYARHRAEPRGRISAREADYLDAVVRLTQRTQRQRRLALGGLIAGLAAVILVVSYLALLANSAAARAAVEAARAEAEAARAREQAVQREHEAVRARNATRQAAAEAQRNDPTTALALLREVEPGPVQPTWSALARWSLDAGVARAVVGHPDMVFSVAFSPDGTRIASGLWDKTIRVWRVDETMHAEGEPLVLRGHEAPVFSVAFSPDGRRIASASHDKTVRVWNVDGTAEIVEPPLVLRGHDAWVTSVAFSPDGTRLASASWDKTVRVWHVDGTAEIAGAPLVLRGHDADVFSVAFSPDGRRVASVSRDKTVRVWRVDGTAEIVGKPLVLRGHGERVFSVAFSPDGAHIASASADRTVRVWRVAGARESAGEPLVLRGHEADILSVAFSPDGTRLASASWDKTVRVWHVAGATESVGEPLVLRGHGDAVTSVAFGPDGMHIASASSDRTVRVWRAVAGEPLVLRGHERPINAVAFSPDGKRIASAAHDKTVRVWNADGTAEIAGAPLVLRGHEDGVAQVAFSPDGTRIASASYDKTVRVWEIAGIADMAERPVPALVLRGHERTAIALAFSPDGRRIASASHDRTVRVWNIAGPAETAGEPLVLRGHEDAVWSVVFSPDGRHVASASHDKTVRVWRVDGTAEIAGAPLVLRGHEAGIWSIAFSLDGTRIISASADRTVRVWNIAGPAESAGEPLVLRGHEDGVERVALSPNGAYIASASQDKTVRVWNIAGPAESMGEPLVLRGHEDGVVGVAFSPDGTRIASASHDRTVRVWRDLAPLEPTGRRLWTATTYCLSIELRQSLLGVPADMARHDQAACERRVAAAR